MSTWDKALQPSELSLGQSEACSGPAQGGGWVKLAKVAMVEVAMVVVEADRDEALAFHLPTLHMIARKYFLSSIAECEDDEEKTSIIMVDDRDDRIVYSFSGMART